MLYRQQSFSYGINVIASKRRSEKAYLRRTSSSWAFSSSLKAIHLTFKWQLISSRLKMKLFSFFMTIIAISSALAIPYKPGAIKLSPAARQALAGCNANVCFAISGSSPITPQQFRHQQEFIFNVAAAIQKELEAAAIQYGLRPQIISPLTQDITDFFFAVDDATFLNFPVNFLGGGIIGCQRELANRPASEPKKIVLITDGRSTFGGDPSSIARNFREEGGRICAIGIGFDPSQEPSALQSLVEDEDDIFTLDDFVQLGQLVDMMVQRICH